MKNIFAGLGLWGVVFIIGSIIFGLSVPNHGEQTGLHIQTGLFTACFVVMLHCLVFIHLLGTGLGVKRAVFEHRLPEEKYVQALWKLKMRAFPPAFLCMVLMIMTAVMGGAAQTGNVSPMVHRVAAFVVLLANFITIPIEIRVISENHELMYEVEHLIATQNATPATEGVA